MENKIKVSVIIPIYNVEKYLARCLYSVINQSLKEIEIILVNDGSKDDSQKIIDQFASKDTRIISITKENGGLSDARNKGLDIAKGEYISFVDSDDFVDPTMLETMHTLAKKHEAEITICNLVKVNETYKEFQKLPQSPQLDEKIELKKDFTLFGEMACFACNKLFKRELFNVHRFVKNLHFEDIELIPKLVLESKNIAKTNEYFYKYYERQDSITKSYSQKGLDIFVAVDQVTQFFDSSMYKKNIHELKRFQIFVGFYSFLAYVARIKDKNLKEKMVNELDLKLKTYSINRNDLIFYKRFNKNYLLSLEIKKMIFYSIAILHLKWIKYL